MPLRCWRMRSQYVWRGLDCRYRDRWPEGRRNASGTMILSPRTCVNASGGAELERKETTVTAGNTRTTSVLVFVPPPRHLAAGQRSDPSQSGQPCLLAPSIHQEVRNRVLARCPVNSGRATAARTPPAHKPPASIELECATTPAGTI